MIPRKVSESSLLRKSSTLVSLTTEALCVAVSTALRLADPKTEDSEQDLALVVVATALEHMDQLPQISLDTVSWHDSSNDCWIVVYDKVYDVTKFLREHPGGEEVILEYAGRDATLAFRGAGHTAHAWRALDKYLIGVLPVHERMFKDTGRKAFECPSFTSSLAATC